MFLSYAELKRRYLRYFEEVLRTEELLVPIDFHSRERKSMGTINSLITSILQNNFCSTYKETYTGLEQHEGEEMMTTFSFLGELSL